MCRKYAKEYKVYVFSRKNGMTAGYTTREMAKDLAFAMRELNISNADVLGVGGMIAQFLAIDFPEIVNKLVLAVTLARPNKTAIETVGSCIEMAKRNDYKSIFADTAEKTYFEKYLKGKRWLFSVAGNAGKPKDLKRFLIMANACLTHDSYGEIEKINCPTLVIGGCQDKIVGGRASEEIAEKIYGSELFMYEQLGHGLYEEAKDFDERVLTFLKEHR